MIASLLVLIEKDENGIADPNCSQPILPFPILNALSTSET